MSGEGIARCKGSPGMSENGRGLSCPVTGGHPLDGVESKSRPLCWPIGPEESGVHNHDPGRHSSSSLPL